MISLSDLERTLSLCFQALWKVEIILLVPLPNTQKHHIKYNKKIILNTESSSKEEKEISSIQK